MHAPAESDVETATSPRPPWHALLGFNEKVKLYKVKNKRLPSSIEALYAGEFQPRDPWGNPFVIQNGRGPAGYDIVSYGADGEVGGTGPDADVRVSELD